MLQYFIKSFNPINDGAETMIIKGVRVHIRMLCMVLCLLCSLSLPAAAGKARHGVYKTYYSNGALRTVGWYKKGELLRQKTFFPQGGLLRDEVWDNNLMEVKKEYTPEGRLSAVWNYKTRLLTLYHEDGSVKKSVPLKVQTPWRRSE